MRTRTVQSLAGILGLIAAAASPAATWEITLGGGYRLDAFDWNIADADGSPNVVSELTWKDLRMQTLGIDGRVMFGKGWEISGSFSRGWIYAGENRDSDYLYDDRQGEYSRSENKTRDKGADAAEVSLGYRFRLVDTSAGGKRYSFTPRVGWRYDYLDMRITDGNQTVNLVGPTGPFDGLDSLFQATWQGPWAGFGLDLELAQRWWLGMGWRYRWGLYEGEADWNLRDDLMHPKSQSQEADAWGTAWHVTLRYSLAAAWDLSLRYDQSNWHAKPGTHYFYMATGDVYRQPLNEANQDSSMLNLKLSWRF